MRKFKDIPKFTRRPTYHVNFGLDYYIEDWIKNNEKELGLQLNPDFQRGHVWTDTQQIAYIEYLLRGGTSGKEFYFNRIGGMQDFRNPKSDFVCVDGLQRITAMMRFLNNGIPAFGSFIEEYEDIRMADVTISIWINDLKTRKDVLIWYLEMNSSGTPHTEQELNKVKRMIWEESKLER